MLLQFGLLISILSFTLTLPLRSEAGAGEPVNQQKECLAELFAEVSETGIYKPCECQHNVLHLVDYFAEKLGRSRFQKDSFQVLYLGPINDSIEEGISPYLARGRDEEDEPIEWSYHFILRRNDQIFDLDYDPSGNQIPFVEKLDVYFSEMFGHHPESLDRIGVRELDIRTLKTLIRNDSIEILATPYYDEIFPLLSLRTYLEKKR